MLDIVGQTISRVIRSLMLGLAAGLLALAGVAFLTASAWTALSYAYGGVVASAVIGVACLLAGLGIALISRRGQPPAEPVPEDAQDGERKSPLVEAFLFGFRAGSANARRRRS